MNKHIFSTSRREFLKTSLLGGAALFAGPYLGETAYVAKTNASNPHFGKVSLTRGEDRADNTFRALAMFKDQIKSAIGNKRVIIKPNNVSNEVQLAATHADCIEGILEFLHSIGKTNVVIAESAASGPTMEGFDNFKYLQFADKYGVKFLDLDEDDVDLIHIFNQSDFRPHSLRVARTMLDRKNNFIISAAKFKTHDRVVATLSLKNIVVGAPIKDAGFRWGRGSTEGAKNDKPIVHGSGFRAINFNLFDLASHLRPHLAVIDGYRGMEGNGPVGGTPVEHRIAVAGLDWLAADRVAAELMGIDFTTMGYLNFCGQAGMGEVSLNKIEVMGEEIADNIKPYKLSENIQKQLIWLTPPKVS